MRKEVRKDSEVILESLAQLRDELVGFAMLRVRDRARAEDLVQDAYTRAASAIEALEDPAAARAWMYRTLRNVIVDRARRDGTSERALAEAAHDPSFTEAPAATTTACHCVVGLAHALRPDYALALQRAAIDDASMRELAAETGTTPGNAAVRVHRARAALRDRVNAHCGACAAAGCVDCDCARPAT